MEIRAGLLYLARSAWNAYKKTGSQKEYEMALDFMEKSGKLGEKIEHHDYTLEDSQIKN